jgi:transcriptional regulator with XRE-family HTH domain
MKTPLESTDPLSALVGANCRVRRQALGISQSQLAWAVSSRGSARWTAATVSGLETGRRNLALSELADLLSVLQLSLAEALRTPPEESDGYQLYRIELLTQPRWQGDTYGPRDADPREARERRLEENVWKAIKGGHPTPAQRTRLEMTAVELFGHPLLDERDARARDSSQAGSPPSKAALGHATRSIISDLISHIDQKGGL